MYFTNYLIVINVVAFLLCYTDKKLAIFHKRRISENTLLLVSIMGGCYGFLTSMYLFHHKTRKIKFKLIYLFCILWLFLIFRLYN